MVPRTARPAGGLQLQLEVRRTRQGVAVVDAVLEPAKRFLPVGVPAKPGMEIKALGPAGEFSCTLHPAAKYLFLSGGSGITPLMSMSRTFYELGEDRDIAVVHSARTPRDIIFRRELEMMTNTSSGRTGSGT